MGGCNKSARESPRLSPRTYEIRKRSHELKRANGNGFAFNDTYLYELNLPFVRTGKEPRLLRSRHICSLNLTFTFKLCIEVSVDEENDVSSPA